MMDIKKYVRWGQMGTIFGSNAITAYVLSYVLLIPFTAFTISNGENLQEFFMNDLINAGGQPELISLAWAIFFTSLCFIPVWVLYRKKIFIKI
jgi:predicted acyltransferase